MSLVEPNFWERRTRTEKLWMLICGLGIVLVIGGILWWTYSDDTKKEGQLIGNVASANGQNAVIGNLVANQEKTVNVAANKTNQAVNDLHDSVNRDSGNFSPDPGRFCRDFPNDSTCH